MNTLRTPDERFTNLPDYPFSANYVEIKGLRMHSVDEGTTYQKHVDWMNSFLNSLDIVQNTGRFIQEDKGEEWAKVIVSFMQDNP